MAEDAEPRATVHALGSAPLARIDVLAPVSVVVPVFREAENVPELVARLGRLRREHGLTLELLLVDDDSRDGTVEAVQACGQDWVRLLVRTGERGLSQAVVAGVREARHPVVVVMDGDLSHPPEKIPAMVLALESGQQFVIGSRYVPGGSTDDDWGFLRWLNSRVATLLAWPLTRAKDPMAGFFAFRRADLARAAALNPVGYKIGLELIVKCGFDNVGEVPIAFRDRVRGESKLTLKQQLLYLQHLRRLYMHRFGTATAALQFAAVGASGAVVNLAVLTLLVRLGRSEALGVAGGIATSVVTNFLLNRRFTFSDARSGSAWRQFAGFLGACAFGAAVNFAVTLGLQERWPTLPIQAAALGGIGAGMVFNFLANRFIVFKATHHRGA